MQNDVPVVVSAPCSPVGLLDVLDLCPGLGQGPTAGEQQIHDVLRLGVFGFQRFGHPGQDVLVHTLGLQSCHVAGNRRVLPQSRKVIPFVDFREPGIDLLLLF